MTDAFWLWGRWQIVARRRRGLWRHRRSSFLAEYGLQLFTFVIKPDQLNGKTARSKPLGGAENASRAFVFGSQSCRRGRRGRGGLVFCDCGSSLSCGFFLCFAGLSRSFSNQFASSHWLGIFCGLCGWSWQSRLLCDLALQIVALQQWCCLGLALRMCALTQAY